MSHDQEVESRDHSGRDYRWLDLRYYSIRKVTAKQMGEFRSIKLSDGIVDWSIALLLGSYKQGNHNAVKKSLGSFIQRMTEAALPHLR